MRLTSSTVVAALLLLTVSSPTKAQDVVYGDRFTYGPTVTREDGFLDYAPNAWINIDCDETSREGLDACLGYTDKWHTGEDWTLEKNYCLHCPADEPIPEEGPCSRHHQSPINLERNVGLGYWNKTEVNAGDPGVGAHPNANECIDIHWMKYEDSFCPLDQMIAADSFTIERHALRIRQPITVLQNETAVINCFKEGLGSRFGRLDYSKGFSDWWFLSHIDIHTPSEHTQEGQRYDAELQLHHFYSVSASIANNNAGTENELGTVTMFMQVYEDAPPYRDLDGVICLWRRKEAETREACGLDPITSHYPGCFPIQNRNLRNTKDGGSDAPTKGKTPYPKDKTFATFQDLLIAHDRRNREIELGLDVTDKDPLPKLHMEESNWAPPEKSDDDWADYIAQQSARFKEDEELWKELHAEFNGDHAKAHDEYHVRGRKLIEGADLLEWFNYWPMLGVRTEYYYRYSGSQTIPPCYGNFQERSRRETVHWRVMKDPIRIHQRQLDELHRLIKERIAPPDDPVMACKPDTAAGTSKGPVDVARPLQSNQRVNFKVFCECKDWPSKWPEDRDWCLIEDANERFYTHPYNFRTDGF